jgi:hypothetical protein
VTPHQWSGCFHILNSEEMAKVRGDNLVMNDDAVEVVLSEDGIDHENIEDADETDGR